MVQQQHRIEDSVDAEDLTRQVKAADARLTAMRTELQEQVGQHTLEGRDRHAAIGSRQTPLNRIGRLTDRMLSRLLGVQEQRWRGMYEKVVKENEVRARYSLPSSDDVLISHHQIFHRTMTGNETMWS